MFLKLPSYVFKHEISQISCFYIYVSLLLLLLFLNFSRLVQFTSNNAIWWDFMQLFINILQIQIINSILLQIIAILLKSYCKLFQFNHNFSILLLIIATLLQIIAIFTVLGRSLNQGLVVFNWVRMQKQLRQAFPLAHRRR